MPVEVYLDRTSYLAEATNGAGKGASLNRCCLAGSRAIHRHCLAHDALSCHANLQGPKDSIKVCSIRSMIAHPPAQEAAQGVDGPFLTLVCLEMLIDNDPADQGPAGQLLTKTPR